METEKTYSIEGTVTIGSDEYRDLIEEAINEKKSAESWMRSKWDVDSKLTAAEKELTKLKSEVASYKSFLAEVSEAAALYRAYLAEQRLKEAVE